MEEIIFVVLRHITKKMEFSEEVWKECYKSIRRFYNNKIVIIDNNSDYSIVKDDIDLENCEVVNNTFYNNRLYAPYYYLLSNNIDYSKAVILHDGVIFQKFVDFSSFSNVKYIWHFDSKEWDNVPLIESQLEKLTNNSTLYDILKKKEFTGCMGCCLAIEKDFLLKIENIYKLTSLKDYINNQEEAIAFERTISIICCSLCENLINDVSFEGEINNMIWGYRFHNFINNDIDVSQKSIIKIFGART